MTTAYLPTEGIGRSSIAGLYDTQRITEYTQCIQETIAHMQRRCPETTVRVLHIGYGLGGLLPTVSCLAGADVTVVDACAEACRVLSARVVDYGLQTVRIVNMNSCRFYDNEPYDLVVMDSYGATLADKSQFMYAWDLVRRGVVRKYDGQFRFIPAEVLMGLSLYTCPSLALAERGVAIAPRGLEFNLSRPKVAESTDPKLKMVPADRLPFTVDLSNCTPISERVELAFSQYGSRQMPLINMSQVTIRAPYTGTPRLWVVEWLASLQSFDELPARHVGTFLGQEASLTPLNRQARQLAWGHLCCPEPRPDAVFHIKIGTKTTGEVILALTDRPGIPKEMPFKHLDALAENTFSKAMANSNPFGKSSSEHITNEKEEMVSMQ
jgi:hypothetical protein